MKTETYLTKLGCKVDVTRTPMFDGKIHEHITLSYQPHLCVRPISEKKRP